MAVAGNDGIQDRLQDRGADLQDEFDRPDTGLRHRARNLAPRPAWLISDVAIAASLLGLLGPSWLLPEACWAPLCRLLPRIPGLADGAALGKTSQNIRLALALQDHRQADRIARDLQAAVYELRMQNLRAWRPGGWRPRIALEGEDRLQQALSLGRGAVLWVGHFAFNSGITKIALHRRGHRVSHLSRPEHGFSKTAFGIAALNPVRCLPEDRHLAQRIVFDRKAPSTAMRKMVQTLRRGEIVSVTAGNWEGTELAEGELCGGRVSLAAGAPRLAAYTGAPLLPVFSVRDPRLGFRVVIDEPIALQDLPPAEQAVAAAAEYLRRHEPWVRQYPDQWRGWKEWRRG